MKKIIGIIALVLYISNSYSQSDETKSNKSGDKKELTFTKEEFRKAVLAEVSKEMKKIGQRRMVSFSKELLEKERKLEEEELNLKKKDEEITHTKGNFKKLISEFQKRQNKFLACRDDIDSKAEKRITHMVDVMSGMRPQNAADVLSVQDPLLSVKILGMLDAVKVSKIFNLMDKAVSARLQKQYMNMKQ